MSKLIHLPGVKELPRSRKAMASRMETMLLTKAGTKAWKAPPFQRPLRVNKKVIAVSEALKAPADDGGLGGVLPGVLILGELGSETYLLDGQHRVEAFLLSGLPEVIADVRIMTFEDLAQMGKSFVNENSRLVTLKPDDVLRGLEGTLQPMRELHKRCPILGYDNIKRNPRGPIVSMSAFLRVWFQSTSEVPTGNPGSATSLAEALTDEDAEQAAGFLQTLERAWGRDPEYWRLWGNLNLAIVAWLWRRTVITQYSGKSVKLTAVQFQECCMALSADDTYLSWLVGRQYGDRDRAPCYARVRGIFIARLKEKLGKQVMFPAPTWATHTSGGRGKS